MVLLPRPPPSILAAASVAFVLAGFDVVQTVLAMLGPDGTGRVGGTFLRDALLVLGGIMLLRRAKWAAWLTLALFALTLLRAVAANEPLPFVVNLLALPGLVLLLVPASRAWWAQPVSTVEAPGASEAP